MSVNDSIGGVVLLLMLSKQFDIKQLNKLFNLNNTFNIINLTVKINYQYL